MATFKAAKVVAALPGTLEPNTAYFLRAGAGFDLYCSDSTGTIAHKLNVPEELNLISQAEAEAGVATTLRAWTSQRVRQAIAGWWAGVTLTKAMVGLSAADNTADSAKNVLSATKLTTPRLIGGVSFDGSANINLPGVNTAGSQNTTGSAASLTTARNFTIGGTTRSFNGTAAVSWTLADIGAVPTSLTVNSKALTGNITLNAADVSARASSWVPAWSDVTDKPAVIAAGVDAATARAAIGAGTSNLEIGSTASTAMAGNTTIPTLPATVTQAEAEAGSVTATRMWTPERVAQAIAALGGGRAPVGYSAVLGSSVSITATTEIQVLTVNFTAVAGQKYLIVGTVGFTKDSGTTARQETVRLRRGTTNSGTLLATAYAASATTASSLFGGGSNVAIDTPGAGSITYRLSAQNASSSTVSASAANIVVFAIS